LYINECKLNGTQAAEINITVQVNGTPNRSSNTPTLTYKVNEHNRVKLNGVKIIFTLEY